MPGPPYFHGTSTQYRVGDYLHTETVSEDPDPDYADLRQMCFATTSVEAALDWACRRSLGDESRDTLFVYEVELSEPEVDTNMHGRMMYPGRDEELTSVMSPMGRIVGLAKAIATADCTNPMGRGFCAACKSRRS